MATPKKAKKAKKADAMSPEELAQKLNDSLVVGPEVAAALKAAKDRDKQGSKIRRIDSYEFDERFYQMELDDGDTVYAPSVTHILGDSYPSAYGFIKWLGDVGTQRAEQIRDEAGAVGTFVHESIENLLTGNPIAKEFIRASYNKDQARKIQRCLVAFMEWYHTFEPEVLEIEGPVWNHALGYAGTRDLLCRIDGELHMVDFKTSKSIHETARMQIVAYHAAYNGLSEGVSGILHLGNTTKKKWSYLTMEADQQHRWFEEFIHTLRLFKSRHPNHKPTEETFPDIYSLTQDPTAPDMDLEGRT